MSDDFIPDADFKPDQEQKKTDIPDFIPDDKFVPDEKQETSLVDKIQKITGTPEEFKQGFLGSTEAIAHGFLGPIATGAEELLSKAGIPISPLVSVGIPGLTQEEREAREKAIGPIASGAGEFVGLGASAIGGPLKLAGAGAEAAMAAKGLTKYSSPAIKIGQDIVKAMTEMWTYGAGEEINRQILGKSNPEHPVAAVIAAGGASSMFGALTGGLFTAGSIGGSALLKEVSKTSVGKYASEFLQDLGNAINVSGEEIPIATTPVVPQKGIQNASLMELQHRMEQAGAISDLPSKSSLQSAINRIEMKQPVHPIQLSSFDSQAARDQYQILKEMPGGEVLQKYEHAQKGELIAKTDEAIQNLAKNEKVTANKIEGGNQASKYFTDQYQAEKKEAGKLVNEAKQLDTEGMDHLTGVVDAMKTAVPEVNNMIEASEAGIKVLPYKTSMGVSKQTYGAIKDAIRSLQDNPQKFSDLFNIRKGLENDVNIFKSDDLTRSQIMGLKSAMMDYMQNMATPDLREGFRRYAINEQQREVIEKIFGASVGNPEFGAIAKTTPETVINDIFADSASINAAKNILPKEKYDHLLGNWIAQAKAAATDPETQIFSSRKFASFLNTNAPELETAFSDNPQGLQRIRDLTTIMKVLPDAPSVNPSGTGKTLVGYLKGAKPNELSARIFDYLKESTTGEIQKQKNIREINQVLAGGKGAQPDGPGIVRRLMDILSRRIGRPIKDDVIPFVLKALETAPEQLAVTLDHADQVSKGDDAMNLGVHSLFEGKKIESHKLYNESDEKNKEKIKKYIKENGLNTQIQNESKQSIQQQNNQEPQNFAKGGLVESQKQQAGNQIAADNLSTIFPDQSSLINQAKVRVYNYLNGLRPQEVESAFPFDKMHQDPAKEKTYNKAVTIADKPLSIINHIQKGTLEPEHLAHLKQMWPEVHGQLSKKIIERMTEARMKKETMPPYHVRQGLAMFLGAPLDSSMTPTAIQAAQSVFMKQKMAAQPGQATKPKKNTSKLGEIGRQHQTPGQAAESRQIMAKR